MGYDAMAIGQSDLDLGISTLSQRAQEAQFPFLSANLVALSDGQSIFDPYVIMERDGLRIGIIGITDQTDPESAALAGRATIEDPYVAAARYVIEIRPQVDLLIVLSRLGLAADQELARAVYGIDVIVGGNTSDLMDAPLQVGNTLIVQQGYRGEWIGRLHAVFSAEGVPTEATEQSIALTQDFTEDPAMAAQVQAWLAMYPEPTLQP